MYPVDTKPCLQYILEKFPKTSHPLSILEYQQKVQSYAKHEVCMPVFI